MSKNQDIYSAGLIIIGNEILSGRTQDANTQHIAVKLNEAGVTLAEVRIIPDIEATIVETVRHFAANYDYVFTTGGIGPTHDDITAPSIAKAFGVDWSENEAAKALLLKHYGAEELTSARLRMANIPAGASLIPNPVSAAPGFQIENVYVMAGVPKIMQAMLDNILPTLKGGDPVLSSTITVAVPESQIAEDLGRVQDEFPAVDIGSYPHFKNGELGVSAVLRSRDGELLVAAQAALLAVLDARSMTYTLGEPV